MPKSESRKRFTFDRPGNYRICVHGFLDGSWSDRLAGLRITTSKIGDQKPVTELVGRVRDQAELAGVLNTLYELHLTPDAAVGGVSGRGLELRWQKTEDRGQMTEARSQKSEHRRKEGERKRAIRTHIIIYL